MCLQIAAESICRRPVELQNVKTDFLLFKFLFLTGLLKYNLHKMKLIHFKCAIQ